MRKSALSFANVEDDIQNGNDSKNQFSGLGLNELVAVKDEALKNNHLGDYEAAVFEIMAKNPSVGVLKEFMEVMTERKDFKRLSSFYSTYYTIIGRIVKTDPQIEWQVRLNHLISNTIANKDTKSFREYKQLRSLLLFSHIKSTSNFNNEDIESKIALADDLINNNFTKTLVGNKQYERIDKTKTAALPYIDVEIIKNISRGDSHLLLLTDDSYVIAYGDNSKGQILPLSTTSNIDKAIYLPNLDSSFELVKARFVFAKENFSAVLTIDNRLLIFGEGWTDKYVLIDGCESYTNIVILKTEILLIGDKCDSFLVIDNSMLKDYLLSETPSIKQDSEFYYTTSIESLERKNISKLLKNPVYEKTTKIVCGSNHVLFLSLSGKLYGYGSNDKNQLCHSKKEKFTHITELQNTKGEIIKSIFAFNDFTLTIDESRNCNITGKISRGSKLIRATSVSRVTNN